MIETTGTWSAVVEVVGEVIGRFSRAIIPAAVVVALFMLYGWICDRRKGPR